MGEQVPATSVHEVAAAEPVIRRVIAARTANHADVEDLVQDCLERLLAARGRLAPEAVLPYAIVTARNMASSHARKAARHAAALPRVLEMNDPVRPEDAVLAEESRAAMIRALARLSPQERSEILAYNRDGPRQEGRGHASSGALRVRMARTRAKLRLEYLIAFRHLELPSPQCRSVLLAISAGDRRRQRELNAGRHLIDCGICATLSEPLGQRSIALTAISLPGALAAWGLAKARAHPAHTAAAVTVGSAAVAAAAVTGPRILAAAPAPHAHARPPSSRFSQARSPVPVIGHLSIDGRPVKDLQLRHSIRDMIGERAHASGVDVVAAVTRNGFWVGSSQARVWVQLVGPFEPLRIGPGNHLRFTGTVVGNRASYPGLVSAVGRRDAGLLARQGAHLAVRTTQIRVIRPHS